MSALLRFRPAVADDASRIAALHAASWRITYRGLFSDAFLDGPVEAERASVWTERFATWDPARNGVVLAERDSHLVGFASVMLDKEPAWGARLDNLHVHPDAKGGGTGRRLMAEAARWVLAHEPGWMLHLMVFEENTPARQFYDAMRGECVERRPVTVEDGSKLVELRYLWRDPKVLAGAASGNVAGP